jgi:deazaflavin-dependent oxidoreductase (nitroreductase family)
MGSLQLRALKVLGESGFWRVFGRLHTGLYRATGGRIGHATGGLTHLLLTTTGRRSGAPRTVPLTYLGDGDAFVLVASNGGSDRHPAWWLNLEREPRATVQVGHETIQVVARTATPEERARLWPRLTAGNPFYARYEQITRRRIPVVVLRRS